MKLTDYQKQLPDWCYRLASGNLNESMCRIWASQKRILRILAWYQMDLKQKAKLILNFFLVFVGGVVLLAFSTGTLIKG
ncbi:hypothetical protein [uncultured Draconibacterium sp.]|uniref:hypothetical protein n=1 Tax=uncultured Draconibacterium sp. TaxID=1573823 RepID=UPI0029C916F6|nr:hypothetical protein [uncultured Draconibacterium sp.]